jgi:hypothetical protein
VLFGLPRAFSQVADQDPGALKLRIAAKRLLNYYRGMLQGESTRGLILRCLGQCYALMKLDPKDKTLKGILAEVLELWRGSALPDLLHSFLFLKGIMEQADGTERQLILKKCCGRVAVGQWSWRNYEARNLTTNMLS